MTATGSHPPTRFEPADQLPPSARWGQEEFNPLRRAFACLARELPEAAARAECFLAATLRPVIDSPWTEVAHRFSQLTGDGFPVELSFTSAAPCIRYTTEIAGPETPESTRWPLVQHRLGPGSHHPLTASCLRLVAEAQAKAPLRFGAWLGARHGFQGDTFKLYAEIPAASASRCEPDLWRECGVTPVLPARRGQLCLVGYTPPGQRLELYYRVPELAGAELTAWIRAAGLGDGIKAMFSCFDVLCEARTLDRWSKWPLGLSLALDLARSPRPVVEGLSVFFYARSVFGGDAAIRRRLLALAERFGWHFTGYREISAPLAQSARRVPCHGLLGVTVSHASDPLVTLGLRPP